MLKLFSKPKTEELLPPPPPFPSLELDESESGTASEDRFKDLFGDIENFELEKPAEKGIKLPKKLSKKELRKLKARGKEAKSKKVIKEKPDLKESELDLGLDLMPEKDKFPDLELDFDEIKPVQSKPGEIKDAEQEIKNAIEGIKKQEKMPFFSGLFKKRLLPKQISAPETEVGDLSTIKNKINAARLALMGLDLETAKVNYMEIMGIYNRLKPEDQAEVYQEISDIYYERKNAEELKV